MKTLRWITVLLHVGALAVVLVMMHRDGTLQRSMERGDALLAGAVRLAVQ